MPDRIAFKQMGEFGEAADYACQRDRQEQHKNEYFDHRELGRDGLCRQFPESLFRFIARAQSNRFWFPIRKKTLFLNGPARFVALHCVATVSCVPFARCAELSSIGRE
jgi:hypothetical protein